MNLKRIIGGPLLSVVFLVSFSYVISSVQWVFENYFSNEIFLGSISDSLQNFDNKNDMPQETIESVRPVTNKPEINALSAVSINSNLQDGDKIVFDKDANLQLPIASLTKLMTAVIVLDNYNLSDTWQVSEAADSQDPLKQDVKLGDVLTVENFLDLMLISSSNKSAYALSELAGEHNFVGLMNQKAKEIGLENTFFDDPTGLSSQNVSNAKDLVKLAKYILNNYPRISEITKKKEFYVVGFGNIQNTNQLLGEVPNIVGGKTGFTADAKGCLILVMNDPENSSDYLISVILGADDRFLEMKKLITWSITQ